MEWRYILQSDAAAALGIGGCMLGLPRLRVVSSDIIAACAFLAAFLVQVMLLLATILNPGKLPANLFKKISLELDIKQKEAFYLFAFYLIAIGGFLAIKATDTWTPTKLWHRSISFSVSFIAVAALSFAVMRTIFFLKTMQDLQSLRHKLLHQEIVGDELARLEPPPTHLQDVEPEAHSPRFGAPAIL